MVSRIVLFMVLFLWCGALGASVVLQNDISRIKSAKAVSVMYESDASTQTIELGESVVLNESKLAAVTTFKISIGDYSFSFDRSDLQDGTYTISSYVSKIVLDGDQLGEVEYYFYVLSVVLLNAVASLTVTSTDQKIMFDDVATFESDYLSSIM